MAKRRPPGPRPPRRPTGDYRTGYCRPPAEHQFKPGQSGNRKGRPKGSRKNQSLADELDAVLAERVPLRSPSGQQTVSMRKAVLLTLMRDAVTGDLASRKLALTLFQIQLAMEAQEQQEVIEPVDEEDPKLDEALLKDFLRRNHKGDGDEDDGAS